VAITGAHVLVYTPEADAVRKLLGDAFGLRSVDAGEGWLIYALPPAELGVHPGDTPQHQLSLMCDDLDATVAELAAKGVEFSGERQEAGWGSTVMMALPGGLEVMLYQPHHATAISPDGVPARPA
jgi:hypothetical protein